MNSKYCYLLQEQPQMQKALCLSSRNLAENINAVSAYVKLMPTDRFFLSTSFTPYI